MITKITNVVFEEVSNPTLQKYLKQPTGEAIRPELPRNLPEFVDESGEPVVVEVFKESSPQYDRILSVRVGNCSVKICSFFEIEATITIQNNWEEAFFSEIKALDLKNPFIIPVTSRRILLEFRGLAKRTGLKENEIEQLVIVLGSIFIDEIETWLKGQNRLACRELLIDLAETYFLRAVSFLKTKEAEKAKKDFEVARDIFFELVGATSFEDVLEKFKSDKAFPEEFNIDRKVFLKRLVIICIGLNDFKKIDELLNAR
jgi:hypothetical protein